jgi:predicted nuclease of predicted toxin-antitoxin system
VKFLIDHQLPPAPVSFIRECGHQCQHLLEIGMEQSRDIEVSNYATSNDCIIVTKDEDFFYLSRRSGSDFGLLWVRLGNCRTKALLAAFSQQWTEIVRCFEDGDRTVEIR